MKPLCIIYCLLFLGSSAYSQSEMPAVDSKWQSQDVICDSMKYFLSSGNYHEAYGLLLKFPDSCSDEQYGLVKAEILMRSYEFTLALFQLNKIDEDQRTPELVQAISRVSELRTLDSALYAGMIQLDSISTSATDIPFISNRTDQRVLNDSIYIHRHFPQKNLIEKRYQIDKPCGDDPKWEREVYKQDFTEIGPSEIVGDSLLLLSALNVKPFRKLEKQQFDIRALNTRSIKWDKVLKLETGGKKMHPTVKDDILVFSSDMDGGYGGMDLWQAKITASGYENLKNLGPSINSTANEVFPKWNDGKLYFASDRTTRGYGGLDIYKWEDDSLYLMSYPINSAYDDYGFSQISEDTTRFFSNRPGGVGKDDVYYVVNAQKEDFFTELSGRIDAPGVDLTGVQVKVSKEDGTFLGYATMDDAGYFKIRHIKGDENYQLEIIGEDLPDDSGLKLYNDQGDILSESKVNPRGSFIFELLTPADYFLLRKENKDESVLSIDIFGQVEVDEKPEEGLKIYLEDSEGELIGVSTTNLEGVFEFEDMKPDAQYTIRSEVKDPNSVIRILGDDGSVLQTIHPSDNEGFVFIRLSDKDKVITITNELGQEVSVSENEQFNLPVIHFELNQSILSKDGEQALDKLIVLLEKNPAVSADISGHTDSQGRASYNLKLSQERMDAVIQYLQKAGINGARLYGKGYGESKLKNGCKDGVECTEAQHAVNRRTEIRVYKK